MNAERMDDEREEWSRELLGAVVKKTLTKKARERMRDLMKLDAAVSEEDHHQEVLLLMLKLMQQYNVSVGRLLSPRFISTLRTAFERDLLDALARWEVHLYKGHRRKVLRAYLQEIDPDVDRSPDQVEDRRYRYAAVVASPERDYEIALTVARIRKLLSDSAPVSAFLADLLANADLCDHAGEGLELYRSRYGEYDRIPAKAMADAHGLSEHHRKATLRNVTAYLEREGIVKGETRAYREKHGPKRRVQKATQRRRVRGQAPGYGRRSPPVHCRFRLDPARTDEVASRSRLS